MAEEFKGTVAWFDAKRGFGFIVRDDGKKDIFVHYSDIDMSGFKLIMAGDVVSFEESTSFNEKLKAANVKVLISRRAKADGKSGE